MNKQQLASKIWDSCNKMRGKIEPNEYKDILLGFIFYKYLCDRLISKADEAKIPPNQREQALRFNSSSFKRLRRKLGYFIEYQHLFSTFLQKGINLKIQDITDALVNFNEHVVEENNEKKENNLLKGIFDNLEKSLSKLGDPKEQANHVRELLKEIADIPSQSKTYDVLGFVYEYLIACFASSAGKKAGEFYTPSEVSVLMSEILASFFKTRTPEENKKISLYDSACGSGSLLLHIRHILAEKYQIIEKNQIDYKAQELISSTCNLTKMNLIMRAINPSNIDIRNADTLKEDWPRGEDGKALWVDACVSNPPYSAHWDSSTYTNDARYKDYGIAPLTKADYAFLLHDLYHLKPDGIMAIVLPPGVLSRGNEEGKIRQNLLEKNKIDAIINLPPNLFFGTSISTIIMVLKQNRANSDVFIIDASNECIKEGNKNKLQARHVRKIVDVLEKREDVPYFARKVELEEIRAKNYVLSISSYIAPKQESKDDLNALILGGIPKWQIQEIDSLEQLNVKEKLFIPLDQRPGYYQRCTGDILEILNTHAPIKAFKQKFKSAFGDFKQFCTQKFLKSLEYLRDCPVPACMEELREEVFKRFDGLEYLDSYQAFQILEDNSVAWLVDLETIQLEGDHTIKETLPLKKGERFSTIAKHAKCEGKIIPLECIASQFFKSLNEEINRLNIELEKILAEKQALLFDLEPEEVQDCLGFFGMQEENVEEEQEKSEQEAEQSEAEQAIKTLKAHLKDKGLEKLLRKMGGEILMRSSCTTQARLVALHDFLEEYKDKSYKQEREQRQKELLEDNTILEHFKDLCNRDLKSFNTSKLKAKCLELVLEALKQDQLGAKLVSYYEYSKQEKPLKDALKTKKDELVKLVLDKLKNLSDKEIITLLEQKWFDPLENALFVLPNLWITDLARQVQGLENRYNPCLQEVQTAIIQNCQECSAALQDLEGFKDHQGLQHLVELLKV
ncbi:type I restriction-modification system subunit M [Helicobacter suis]|uniref:type I restriction-modification system subunit M n=1 Tax=Helicobacter suis TaxID=104628 RepID=UPI0013D8873A|nr:type I restriction-modification system subunit M [Helicobacter suis]